MKRLFGVVMLATALLAAAIDVKAIPAPMDVSGPTDVWDRYVIAEKRFQFDLFEITSGKWNDIESTLRGMRDQQLTLIEMRNMRFRHLVRFHPRRIVSDDGLSRFANFSWTDADSRALRGINPDYVKLETFLGTVTTRLEGDPLLPEAQERSLTLPLDQDFTDLSTRFDRYTNSLDSELAKD